MFYGYECKRFALCLLMVTMLACVLSLVVTHRRKIHQGKDVTPVLHKRRQLLRRFWLNLLPEVPLFSTLALSFRWKLHYAHVWWWKQWKNISFHQRNGRCSMKKRWRKNASFKMKAEFMCRGLWWTNLLTKVRGRLWGIGSWPSCCLWIDWR